MNNRSATPPVEPDCPVARDRIKIIARPDGGKEFILPAARNYREKMQSTAFLFIVAAIFVGILLFAREFMNVVPFAWAKFLLANFFFIPVAVFGLAAVVLGIACGDIWLRSSHVIAMAGQLQVVTRWLFITRKATLSTRSIIQTRAANTTTVNGIRYYDIEVRTLGTRPSWYYRYFPPKKDLDEIELQRIRTGGQSIRALTEIEGQAEAERILSGLRAALGITV